MGYVLTIGRLLAWLIVLLAAGIKSADAFNDLRSGLTYEEAKEKFIFEI